MAVVENPDDDTGRHAEGNTAESTRLRSAYLRAIPDSTEYCATEAIDRDADCNATEFTIAAFNAHWGVGRFRPTRGVRFNAANVIASFDADIVIVAESWHDKDGRGMLDSLTGMGYHVESAKLLPVVKRNDCSRVHDLAPPEAAWELALCSRYPVVEHRAILLPRVDSDPTSGRHALTCTIDIAGRNVEVVALHTSSKLHRFGPVRQLFALKQQLDTAGPQVIAGDFNLWGPPISIVMPGWTRPVRGRTYPSHRPHSQIDHVLVRGGVEAVDGQVLAATPSDHRPVRARLRLPNPLP